MALALLSTAFLSTLMGCSAPPLPDFGEVPPFTLTSQKGETITRDSLRGKVWVANFIFTTCPDICPMLSSHMAEVQARYPNTPDLRLVSFSVDPVTDTPPVLDAYAARFHADPARWLFVTGPLDALRPVVVDGFKQALEAQPATDTQPATILHGSRFVLVDKAGHIRGFPDPREPGKKEMFAGIDALL